MGFVEQNAKKFKLQKQVRDLRAQKALVTRMATVPEYLVPVGLRDALARARSVMSSGARGGGGGAGGKDSKLRRDDDPARTKSAGQGNYGGWSELQKNRRNSALW
jgi:hypothetical protein